MRSIADALHGSIKRGRIDDGEIASSISSTQPRRIVHGGLARHPACETEDLCLSLEETLELG